MECSTRSWFLLSRKHSASRGSRFRRWSVWRSRKAPPSELIVPPSKRATTSRLPQALNPKLDWVHSVIAKAVLSLVPTVVWKLSYAMKDGLLPIAGEICGLRAMGLPGAPVRGQPVLSNTYCAIGPDSVMAPAHGYTLPAFTSSGEAGKMYATSSHSA